EVRPHFVADEPGIKPRQLVDDVLQRRDRKTQRDELFLDLVEASDRIALESLLEHVFLELLQLLAEAPDDRKEVVDDEVEHRVEPVARTEAEQLRRLLAAAPRDRV